VSAHDVINPATEEVVQSVTLADEGEADAAIARAAAAAEGWRAIAPADRAVTPSATPAGRPATSGTC
jgi:acyl-CoA reductase-like NAD-dependent aldehyde dehydrogenase